ncbi:hypothetical protein MVEN_00339000 [Mycena venus]|uniref:Uncharacterized protein n=1 Tax=Mycena venus TaxID=2733690 RepID=A0A8H6YT38_9AGAR|nr:hypothetical protein MVEN_00339000 [Mycena venus]
MSLAASPRLIFLLALLAVYLPSILSQHVQRNLGKRDAFSDSGLSLASWIWLPESDLITTAPAGTVAFIKTLTTPPGKTAVSAHIAITVDNNFTLWCNSQPIGDSDGIAASGWKTAQVFSAALNGSANVFSVLATNANPDTPGAANPAGLLAAIRIFYSDSSNETVLSDNTWVVSGSVPADFPAPLDLSSFVPAEIATKYGSGAWGMSVSVSTPDTNALNLTGSLWIWSTANASVSAAVGTVGFRKTVVSPSGKSASSATVLLSVDNTFQLLINGQYVGSPPFDNNAAGSTGSWEYAQRFTVTLTPSNNVFTVLATNFPPTGSGTSGTGGTSAGMIAALQIKYTDGSSDIVRSDTSWLAGPFTSADAFLHAADSTLGLSIAQGPFGMAPWGQIGVSDALSVLKLPANNAAVAAIPNGPLTTATTTTPGPASTTILPTTTDPSSPNPSSGSGSSSAHGRISPRLVSAFAFSVIMTCFVL